MSTLQATRSLTGGSLRRWQERAIHAMFALTAAASIVVLIGIFGVLVQRAFTAFTLADGMSRSTLTAAQQALFSPEELAALPETPPPPPGVLADFLGSTAWNPTGNPAGWGVGAMVVSTLLVTISSLVLSAPLGIAVASWLAYVAGTRTRELLKPVIEILAAIPSVVVGFLGIVWVGPFLSKVFHLNSGLSALNGAVLLGVMSLPTIISLSEDAIRAVPKDYVQASLALGADRWQTLWRVVLPSARSGIVAALMLGMGRAIGETMTVLMACGNAVAMPGSLFDPVRTLTATVAIELGEVAQQSRHYYMLFSVGLVLFCMTFVVNLVSEVMVRRSVGGRA